MFNVRCPRSTQSKKCASLFYWATDNVKIENEKIRQTIKSIEQNIVSYRIRLITHNRFSSSLNSNSSPGNHFSLLFSFNAVICMLWFHYLFLYFPWFFFIFLFLFFSFLNIHKSDSKLKDPNQWADTIQVAKTKKLIPIVYIETFAVLFHFLPFSWHSFSAETKHSNLPLEFNWFLFWLIVLVSISAYTWCFDSVWYCEKEQWFETFGWQTAK